MANYEYPKLKVDSPNCTYSLDERGHEQLESLYEYEHVRVERDQSANTIKVSQPEIKPFHYTLDTR